MWFDMKAILLLAVCLLSAQYVAAAELPKVLNLLCWVSYEERAMLEPFEKKYNAKVKYKTFFGDDQMYALLASSKGQYDVVTVGPEYVRKLHKIGRLAAMNPADYDCADYFKPFQKFPLCWFDDRMYSVVVGFGMNGIVYNTKHVTAKDVESYEVLWSPKFKGKVGIWDWYLPTMGTLSAWLGNPRPTDIDDVHFQTLEKRLMALRPNVAGVFGTCPEINTALANEQVWLIPGLGESMAAPLKEQGRPIDWTIPREGGQLWIESLSIPNDAPHPEVAKLYIQWMQTAAAQKLLSERNAYYRDVPNRKAYDLMTARHKDALKIHNEADAISLINKLHVRYLPSQQPETRWQDVWQRFKAAR
jgi:spermidine/putrescine transport system substrate-binding protein